MNEVITNQLAYYADRAGQLQAEGNTDLRDFFIQQGRDLIAAFDEELMFIDTENLNWEDDSWRFFLMLLYWSGQLT